MRTLRFELAAAIGCLAVFSATGQAEDYFLTVGGGYSPAGNQISLEKNVLFLRQLLAEQKPGVRHDVLFADGNSPGRDLQFHPLDPPVPRVNALVARVFNKERYLGYHYRSHDLGAVRDASSPESLARWFEEVGKTLRPGDRLFLYITAHGGRGDRKSPQNTKLFMWNNRSINVSDLVAHLDKLPQQVPVVTVMVQCYAGGFADIVFNEAQSKKGLSAANRCGFYATVHDRVAAGCTADINEENYHEYSSYFWAALRGKTRTGQPIDPPDYNEDGAVSFDEAHAYALLESDTIDISVTTSDAVLRAISKTKDKDRPDLLTPDSPFDELFAHAGAADRAVLSGLSTQLVLSGDNRAKAARDLAADLLKQKKAIGAKRNKLRGEYENARKKLQAVLMARWPELNNLFNPQVIGYLTTGSSEIVAAIESHSSYADFTRLHEEMESLSDEQMTLDRRWVKCQRLLRALENVALAANLPQVASPGDQRRYAALLAAQSQTLTPAPAPTAPSPQPPEPAGS